LVPRPDQPWHPAAFQVFDVNRRLREVWVRDGRSGERVRRKQPRFDVRYRADGHDFRYGFGQRGWAEAFARQLREGAVRGWLFDPRARRFIDPGGPVEPVEAILTVFDHLGDYFARKWQSWEPASRRNAQRDLARACLFLVRKDAPALSRAARLAADAYLRDVALMVPAPQQLTGEQERWTEWFARWSLPLADVTDQDLQAFLVHVGSTALDGKQRQLAASSLARTRAVVRAAFTHARKRRLIEWDPWEPVQAPSLRDLDRVDPDLVMAPQQVRAMADACAAINPRYEAFVLVHGLCGLRPGEAIELRRRDIGFRDGRPVNVTSRGTYSSVPQRFLAPGESRRRPLKGRGRRASRTIPLPSELVEVIERHLAEFVGSRADAHVFTTPGSRPLNLSNFHRNVWAPARQAVFTQDDPLRRVRRHDLRHAAITAWLNAGVPLKTAQAWSGHKTASVLLDTYLGVIRGDEDLALSRFEALLHSHDPPEGPNS
jgi:integrase